MDTFGRFQRSNYFSFENFFDIPDAPCTIVSTVSTVSTVLCSSKVVLTCDQIDFHKQIPIYVNLTNSFTDFDHQELGSAHPLASEMPTFLSRQCVV